MSFFCRFVKPTAGDSEDGRETPVDNHDAIEKETNSFIAMAALSSLWLPSVVGPQSQRIFLVSGITSLVTKVLLLVVAVALADAGLLSNIHRRPFFLFCFKENSTDLNVENVTKCRFSEENCFQSRNMTHEEGLSKVLADLEEYNRILKNIDNDLNAVSIESVLFQNESNNPSIHLDEVKRLKGEVEEKLRFSRKLQQKVRICEKDETSIRLFILSGLLVVLALAAFATYRLHRIADYQVIKFSILQKFIKSAPRNSSMCPKPSWAAYRVISSG